MGNLLSDVRMIDSCAKAGFQDSAVKQRVCGPTISVCEGSNWEGTSPLRCHSDVLG
jgi:hypothetical protein